MEPSMLIMIKIIMKIKIFLRVLAMLYIHILSHLCFYLNFMRKFWPLWTIRANIFSVVQILSPPLTVKSCCNECCDNS